MAGVASNVVSSESGDYSGDAYGYGVESGAWYKVMGIKNSIDVVNSGYYAWCSDSGAEADSVSSDSGDESAGIDDAGVGSSGSVGSSVSGEDSNMNGSVGVAG